MRKYPQMKIFLEKDNKQLLRAVVKFECVCVLVGTLCTFPRTRPVEAQLGWHLRSRGSGTLRGGRWHRRAQGEPPTFQLMPSLAALPCDPRVLGPLHSLHGPLSGQNCDDEPCPAQAPAPPPQGQRQPLDRGPRPPLSRGPHAADARHPAPSTAHGGGSPRTEAQQLCPTEAGSRARKVGTAVPKGTGRGQLSTGVSPGRKTRRRAPLLSVPVQVHAAPHIPNRGPAPARVPPTVPLTPKEAPLGGQAAGYLCRFLSPSQTSPPPPLFFSLFCHFSLFLCHLPAAPSLSIQTSRGALTTKASA